MKVSILKCTGLNCSIVNWISKYDTHKANSKEKWKIGQIYLKLIYITEGFAASPNAIVLLSRLGDYMNLILGNGRGRQIIHSRNI